ncbi:hypothetical protein PHAMO_380034 [Magnetospirillum molischianum DSM 120]|uniref:Uncharacterized protein n=1 Tax=Magnetospirillum molischianum DSM 120 TaxID=1150626 RepID=H8FVH8_MAGML|nr:hypothetical protein PHAMO_380034 [Magnetospirillum molischianum DSM 120]
MPCRRATPIKKVWRCSIRLPPADYGTGPHLITLFQSADRSTLFHESAHLWLQELIDHANAADAPAAFRADLDAAIKWMGGEHWGQIGDREYCRFAVDTAKFPTQPMSSRKRLPRSAGKRGSRSCPFTT